MFVEHTCQRWYILESSIQLSRSITRIPSRMGSSRAWRARVEISRGATTLTRDIRGKRLEVLTEVVPGIARVGILRDANAGEWWVTVDSISLVFAVDKLSVARKKRTAHSLSSESGQLCL